MLDAFNAGGAGVNSHSTNRTFEIADNLDFTIGRKHAMRVGALVSGGLYRNYDARNAAGTFTFSSLESLPRAARRCSSRSASARSTRRSPPTRKRVYWQDDIRMTRTLTISVGVRQEMQSLIADKLNVMPRVGLTYSPRNSKTIVRGGYGLFYDWYDSEPVRPDAARERHLAARPARQLPGLSGCLRAVSRMPACAAALGAGVAGRAARRAHPGGSRPEDAAHPPGLGEHRAANRRRTCERPLPTRRCAGET